MGYRLYREVIEHGPPDVTPGELVVWLVIADDANDDTRLGWIANDVLSARARMTASGVQRAIQRLAGRSYELRVARGVGKNGRTIYAYRGTQTTYRLPVLAPANGGTTVPPLAEERTDHSPTIAEKGGTTVPERWDHSPGKVGPQSHPSPQSPQNPQQRSGQPSNDEKAGVLAEIRRRRPDASDALIRHILREEGPDILTEIRAHATRQHLADWRASLAAMPPCPDGNPGGDQLRPDTREPQCALCRARHRRTAA